MTHAISTPSVTPDHPEAAGHDPAGANRAIARWMAPLEALSAALMVAIVVMLFGGVVARYAFGRPVTWIDEAVSFAFIWVAMLGAVIAMHRNEHLRLTMFIDKMSPRARGIVHAFALVAMAAFLIGLIGPAVEHLSLIHI